MFDVKIIVCALADIRSILRYTTYAVAVNRRWFAASLRGADRLGCPCRQDGGECRRRKRRSKTIFSRPCQQRISRACCPN